jgi:hypothetical protein
MNFKYATATKKSKKSVHLTTRRGLAAKQVNAAMEVIYLLGAANMFVR